MKKIFLLLTISIAAVCSGCATYYNVRVNGYLDTTYTKANIVPGRTIFILENKKPVNPIFETEIKLKIERLLKEKNYIIQSYDNADFYLRFTYSVSPGRIVSDIRPVYYPGETGTIRTITQSGRVRTAFINFPGYTEYIPYRYTVYTASLSLEVIDAVHFRNTKEEKIVWIGEVFNTSQNPDLRESINYLLVAVFDYFAENTYKGISTIMKENDLRVKRLLQ